MKLVALLMLVAIAATVAECKNWVLLVAGSNGYYNYRHQADICHAYHVVRNHGVPAENIVTMMYDDIANSPENPIQGNVINQPDGPNVYPGVVIDYKGEDVTPDVFLAALTGDKTKAQKLTNGRGSKVIESGPNDHVFVNFADHGAPGLLAFPSDELLADKLKAALQEMYENKKYKKLVLYVEACESGSMFDKLLPASWNIFATTAANPDESSYACYFDDKRNTYLGDVYSVNWMEDSDKENLDVETLSKQFSITKDETNTSHVMEYGDLTISKMTVAEFQGNETSKVKVPRSPRSPLLDAVPAHQVELEILKRKLLAAPTVDERRQISERMNELINHHSAVDQLFADTVEWLNKEAQLVHRGKNSGVQSFSQVMTLTDMQAERRPITNWACYSSAIQALKYSCSNLRLTQDYRALKQLYILVNLCERGDFTDFQIRSAIMSSAFRQRSLCGLRDGL